MRARRTLPVVLTLALAACSPAEPPPRLPKPPARAMQASKSEGPVRVAAEPYVEADRQKKLFGRSLEGWELVPVLVLVENTGEDPLVLRRRDVSLLLPDGGELRADRSSARVAEFFESEALAPDRAVGVRGVPGSFKLDLGLSYLFSELFPSKQRERIYAGWTIQERSLLLPGQPVWGFAYFVRPPGSDVSEAILRLRLRVGRGSSSSTRELVVELLLSPMIDE